MPLGRYLVRRFGPDQPFYAVIANGFYPGQTIIESARDMVQAYVAEIISVRSQLLLLPDKIHLRSLHRKVGQARIFAQGSGPEALYHSHHAQRTEADFSQRSEAKRAPSTPVLA